MLRHPRDRRVEAVVFDHGVEQGMDVAHQLLVQGPARVEHGAVFQERIEQLLLHLAQGVKARAQAHDEHFDIAVRRQSFDLERTDFRDERPDGLPVLVQRLKNMQPGRQGGG